ncbi:MAG: class I SAM-dependent methyltransferase [Deltaproteobacteria bacterium]|nr:class I SAM-dependent methyltransferase [Deltaproteobacteria bacterium]
MLVLAALSVRCKEKPAPAGRDIVHSFNHYYLAGPGMAERIFGTKFLGIQTIQAPSDMWMMQEILAEVQPDLVIETGTYKGGSSLYFALLFEQINPNGKVVTIDIRPQLDASIAQLPEPRRAQLKALAERRIEVIEGSSVDPKLVESLAARAKGKKVLVTLDSCHAVEHVERELQLYAPLVSKGSYLVVQDTRHDDDPTFVAKWSRCEGYKRIGGPGLAVDEFLRNNTDFQVDRMRERFLLTWYPRGYLKRVR